MSNDNNNVNLNKTIVSFKGKTDNSSDKVAVELAFSDITHEIHNTNDFTKFVIEYDSSENGLHFRSIDTDGSQNLLTLSKTHNYNNPNSQSITDLSNNVDTIQTDLQSKINTNTTDISNNTNKITDLSNNVDIIQTDLQTQITNMNSSSTNSINFPTKIVTITSTKQETIPDDCNGIIIKAVGAGGGGGGYGGTYDSAGGGGSGAYAEIYIDKDYIHSNNATKIYVEVGNGGNGGSGTSNGNAGGPSYIKYWDGSLNMIMDMVQVSGGNGGVQGNGGGKGGVGGDVVNYHNNVKGFSIPGRCGDQGKDTSSGDHFNTGGNGGDSVLGRGGLGGIYNAGPVAPEEVGGPLMGGGGGGGVHSAARGTFDGAQGANGGAILIFY